MRQGVNLQFDTSTFLSFNWDTVRVLCWELKDDKKILTVFNFHFVQGNTYLSDSKYDVQDCDMS